MNYQILLHSFPAILGSILFLGLSILIVCTIPDMMKDYRRTKDFMVKRSMKSSLELAFAFGLILFLSSVCIACFIPFTQLFNL